MTNGRFGQIVNRKFTPSWVANAFRFKNLNPSSTVIEAIKDEEHFVEMWPRIVHYFENCVVVANNPTTMEVSVFRLEGASELPKCDGNRYDELQEAWEMESEPQEAYCRNA